MKLSEWFDVNKKEHLEAYYALRKEGYWPLWFQRIMDTDKIEIDDLWQVLLAAKMADAWIDYKLIEQAEQGECTLGDALIELREIKAMLLEMKNEPQ